MSCSLANSWTHADDVVLVAADDYASAVMASSFAARVDAPLFFIDGAVHDTVADAIGRLGAKRAFVVAGSGPAAGLGLLPDLDLTVITFGTAHDALAWLLANGFPLDYLALVNPNDRCAGTSQKLSLTAPLYTAHHRGFVIALIETPVEKDLGDGPALRRALEHLQTVFCDVIPEHLALVGGFDVIPVCRTKSDHNGSKIWAVTDMPFGVVEQGSSFRDIAIGRIFTDCICSGSLLAARTVVYDRLKDGRWDRTFVEAGSWAFPELRPLFENVGFDKPRHMVKQDFDSCVTVEAAAILHKDHSGSTGLGNAINTSTTALYAPTVLVTRGCNGAGIDEGSPCVAGRMLGRGAVAYVGSPRYADAPSTLTDVAFFNCLLYGGGMTLGQAMRAAFNKTTTHWLDGSVVGDYQRENQILLGDPGLRIGVPGPPAVAPMTAVLREATGVVTVQCCSSSSVVPIHRMQLEEWGFQGDLFTCVAPFAEPETHWSRDLGADAQALYYTAAITLPAGTSVSAVAILDVTEIADDGAEAKVTGDAARRWWMSGKHYQQNHQNGMTTIRWRVLLLDFDQLTGRVGRRVASARFQFTWGSSEL